MKKFSKILLGIAAVLGVTGCGFTVAGSAMGAGLEDVHYEGHSVRHMMRKMERLGDIWDEDDWDEDDDDWDEDDDWEDDSRSRSAGSASSTDDTEDYSFDNIYSMDIELSCDELILRETDDSKFTVHVEGSDINRVRVGTEGSELQIEGDGKPENRTVIVTYPKGTDFTEISLDIGAGTAFLEDDITAREFSASVGAGTMENSGRITVTESDVEVGIGTLELTDLDTNYLEGECGVGILALDVAGAKTDYSYRISCGTGSILLDNEEFSGLGAMKKIDNEGASRKIQLECGMGTVEVDFEA